MRMQERNWLVVFFAAAAALVTAGCQDRRTPASPSAGEAVTVSVQAASNAAVTDLSVSTRAASKMDVCHVEGNGSFHLINVSDNALPAHLAHGDAQPGDKVPGDKEKVFDKECNQVDVKVNCPCWDERTLPPPAADQCINRLPDSLIAEFRSAHYILDIANSLCYVKSEDPAIRIAPTPITAPQADACLALLQPLCPVR